MTNPGFIRAIIFSAPLISALVCLVLAMLNTDRTNHSIRRSMHIKTIASYCVFILLWFGFVLHSIMHAAFLHYVALFVPLLMIGCVMRYGLVYTITSEAKWAFPMAHFVVPAVIFATLAILTSIAPASRLEEIIYGHSVSITKYAVICICFIYSVVYPIISLVRIGRYMRKTADRPSAEHNMVLRWLFGLTIAEFVILPLPALGLFMGVSYFVDCGWMWGIAVLPSFIIYIVSCYDLLSDNYVIVESGKPANIGTDDNNTSRLSRRRIEEYLTTRKPYLDPSYRITNMAEDLFTNRAYISAFINKEYGMNFNRFINGYRLREAERLRAEATEKRQQIPTLQIILNAGFSSYRSYLRAKNS